MPINHYVQFKYMPVGQVFRFLEDFHIKITCSVGTINAVDLRSGDHKSFDANCRCEVFDHSYENDFIDDENEQLRIRIAELESIVRERDIDCAEKFRLKIKVEELENALAEKDSELRKCKNEAEDMRIKLENIRKAVLEERNPKG